MTNQEKIKRIIAHQNNAQFHELTCGNDSQHLPLICGEVDGKVILKCLECDYTQDYIPESVLKG